MLLTLHANFKADYVRNMFPVAPHYVVIRTGVYERCPCRDIDTPERAKHALEWCEVDLLDHSQYAVMLNSCVSASRSSVMLPMRRS